MDFYSLTKTFLWAMTPIGELRASIPIALTAYELSPDKAYIISVLGNIFAAFLILMLLGIVSRWLSKNFYFFNRFFAWLFSKTRKNHSGKVEKYGCYVLPLFVAIPLPVTGAWTASLVAFVFDIPFKKAFPLIVLGVLIAGGIVLAVANTGIAIQQYFGWQALLGAMVAGAFVYLAYKKIKNNNHKKYETSTY
jgi:uncharacterized membrane protein